MLTLDQASKIIDLTLAKGREMKLKPLTVAVLDAGGHYKAFKREDDTSILREKIAYGKAYGALAMGRGSRAIAALAARLPDFVNAAFDVAEGRMVPVPGGVLIRDENKTIIGAVGVSGDLSDADEAAAVAGITGLGLVADPGAN